MPQHEVRLAARTGFLRTKDAKAGLKDINIGPSMPDTRMMRFGIGITPVPVLLLVGMAAQPAGTPS